MDEEAKLQPRTYVCSKCGYNQFDHEEIYVVDSTLGRLLNYQNKKFIAITCKQCGFTEFYRNNENKTGSNFLDLLFG